MALPIIGDVVGSLVNGAVDLFKSHFPPPATESEKLQQATAVAAFRAQHEQLVTNSLIALEAQVTARHNADMNSDSWLSKNIRPTVLIYLLALFTAFAVASASLNIPELYVKMLQEMLQMAFGFYFAGRTIEKVVSLIKGK